jgi:hypothetical protein
MGAAACATSEAAGEAAGGGAAPARLADVSEDNVRALTTALGEALGRARVELGAADMATATTIPVLPPPLNPLETKSTAQPVLFDLEIENEACSAIRRDTGECVALPGVRCRSAD